MQASRPRALVVDDDAALRLLCRVNLELEGFEVAEAADLVDAERAAMDDRPDVVLLDVNLNGVKSYELLAKLRSLGVPVALVTGSVEADDYRDKADDVLTKPFEPQALVAMARRLARVQA